MLATEPATVAAVSCADLQDVAPTQPAQAVENTNLGPLGIKRVDHATPTDFGMVECYELACSAGAMLACATVRFLWPKIEDSAEIVVVPHEQEAGVA